MSVSSKYNKYLEYTCFFVSATMKDGGIGTDLNIHYRLMEDKSDLRTYAHHHSLYKLNAKVQKHKHVRNTHVQIFTHCPLKWINFLRIAPPGASIFTQNIFTLFEQRD